MGNLTDEHGNIYDDKYVSRMFLDGIFSKNEPNTLYRYVDTYTSNGLRASLRTYKVVKETKCGYWFEEPPCWGVVGKKRWVSSDARKRYAYPTREEARTSYIARKKRHYKILKGKTNTLRSFLSTIDELPKEKLELFN